MSNSNTVLFDNGSHSNILLEYFSHGGHAVQANQHLIVDGKEGMILDPGGHKIYSDVLSETFSLLGGSKLRYIFLSHQDPDIVASINGWLMTTDADAYISKLWVRFVPHFGLDHLVMDRLKWLVSWISISLRRSMAQSSKASKWSVSLLTGVLNCNVALTSSTTS